jgi:hypothetical protein
MTCPGCGDRFPGHLLFPWRLYWICAGCYIEVVTWLLDAVAA